MNPLIQVKNAIRVLLVRTCFRLSPGSKPRVFRVAFIAHLLPALVRSDVAAVLMSILVVVSARNVSAQQMVITFDDPQSLAALFYRDKNGGTIVTAGRYTVVEGRDDYWGNAYVEHGMRFFNGVNPPDPRLGPYPQPEYHLNYEEPELNMVANEINLQHPESHHRYLAPHFPGAVIQMTYDPNIPFNLISIDVLGGALNVGVMFADGTIGVYNNLTAGFTWFLDGANNLTRVTFELPLDSPWVHASGFAVDNIVFEPATPGAPASRTPDNHQRNSAPPYLEPPPVALSFSRHAPPPKIDVKPDDDTNTIDPQDTGNLAVAILSTGGFDARIVDCDSIRLGPNGARPLHCEVHDVNRDGHPDLLVLFSIPDIGLRCGQAFLFLTAQAGGGLVTGQDFIHLTGCNDTATPPPIAMGPTENAPSRTRTASRTQIPKRQNRKARPQPLTTKSPTAQGSAPVMAPYVD